MSKFYIRLSLVDVARMIFKTDDTNSYTDTYEWYEQLGRILYYKE